MALPACENGMPFAYRPIKLEHTPSTTEALQPGVARLSCVPDNCLERSRAPRWTSWNLDRPAKADAKQTNSFVYSSVILVAGLLLKPLWAGRGPPNSRISHDS